MASGGILVVGAVLPTDEALEALLAGLHPRSPVPVVIACPRRADDGLLERLWARSALPVVEPDDKDPLIPGRVYLAPAGYRLLVEDGAAALACPAEGLPEEGWVDPLFESAALGYGARAMAVYLGGRGSDGRAGLETLSACGALVHAQADGDPVRWVGQLFFGDVAPAEVGT